MKMKDAVNFFSIRPNTISKWLENFNANKKFTSHPRRFTSSDTIRKAYFIVKEMISNES